jgi:hypothetical protein
MSNQNVEAVEAVVENDFVDMDLSFLDELIGEDEKELMVDFESADVLDESSDSNEELLFVVDELEREEAALANIETDEDTLLSVINEIEADEELKQLYNTQETTVVEVPKVTVVEGNEVTLLKAEESAALGVAAAVKKVRTAKADGTRAERIINQLGADAIDYTTLTPDWSSKDEAAQLEEFSAIISSMAEYVGDKAVNLFSFLKTGGGLNTVTSRAFDVFIRDGQIVGGDQGNIVQNLLTKPYSIGTARSQGNQMIQLFTGLEIGKRTARGTVVVNPDSVILERVKTILGK